MESHRSLFIKRLAQTSGEPLMLEVERASGIYLYGPGGKEYLDMISGISVSALGHNHPGVVRAVQEQVGTYMHLMVYGEFIQAPQVEYADRVVNSLPDPLERVFFVNSGSEANEGALKLAKRYTGKSEIIAFEHAYHGSTHGTLSIIGQESCKTNYRPLLPDIRTLPFNDISSLEQITRKTAAVIIEPVQGEAGVRVPDKTYLKKLRKRCHETGALLIFDEIQTGMGRLGKLFAMEHFGVTPDILTVAKAFGGGMPLGAFIASTEIMQCLQEDPVLGHITTFGGHPVSCKAGLTTLNILQKSGILNTISTKEKRFRAWLIHPAIQEIRGQGLLLAVEMGDSRKVKRIIREALKNGLVTDWFLFCPTAIRLAPPLIIEENEIKRACDMLLDAMDKSG